MWQILAKTNCAVESFAAKCLYWQQTKRRRRKDCGCRFLMTGHYWTLVHRLIHILTRISRIDTPCLIATITMPLIDFFLLPASPTSVQFYYWPVLFSLIKILTRKQTAITLIGPNFAMILCTFSHYITPQHTLFIYPSWCLCVTSFPLSWFIEDFAFFFLKKTK